MFATKKVMIAGGAILLLTVAGCAPNPDRNENKSGETKRADSDSAISEIPEKGQGYGDNVPYLKPASVYWKAKKMITQDILIPKNVQMFEAFNGRKPKTHEEFMEKIIKEGKIPLPKLEEGLEYFYDAKSEKLMVRNLKASAGAGK